jgi:hypothetical protein
MNLKLFAKNCPYSRLKHRMGGSSRIALIILRHWLEGSVHLYAPATLIPANKPNTHLIEGNAVALVGEALYCKPEGRGFDSRWCHWNFLLTILPVALWPWVHSASNRNEYQGCRFIGLKTLSPLCSDCLEIWDPRPPGTLRASNWFALPLPIE